MRRGVKSPDIRDTRNTVQHISIRYKHVTTHLRKHIILQ